MENPSSGEIPPPSANIELTESKHLYSLSTFNENERDLANQSIEHLKTGDPALDYLSKQERNILDRELYTPNVKVSYRMLFRYASRVDILVFIISILGSIGSGVVSPLMAVCKHLNPKLKY